MVTRTIRNALIDRYYISRAVSIVARTPGEWRDTPRCRANMECFVNFNTSKYTPVLIGYLEPNNSGMFELHKYFCYVTRIDISKAFVEPGRILRFVPRVDFTELTPEGLHVLFIAFWFQ